jgi:hypothetical protein
LDNFSHKEIASFLSISEGTSKSNFHRAKLILRNKISTEKKLIPLKTCQMEHRKDIGKLIKTKLETAQVSPSDAV